MNREQLLQAAIKQSVVSKNEGRFPAGAIIASSDGKLVSSAVSGNNDDFKHAELKAIEAAYKLSQKPLANHALYASMEPCLMCLSAAYWAGIRHVFFAVSRKSTNNAYYEGPTVEVNLFNEKIAITHVPKYEKPALGVIIEWEESLSIQ